MRFIFSQDAYDLGVRGAYFSIRGLQNRMAEYEDIQAALSDLISIHQSDKVYQEVFQGFEKLHHAVGPDAAKSPASAQSLHNYHRQHGRLPAINGLVDIYNALSFVSGLALGAHDDDKIDGDVTLKLTSGNELYWPIGSSRKQKIAPGEYAYIDDTPEILCRLEVRQVEKTKVTLDSRNVFFIVQGHQWMDENHIKTTAQKLHDLIIALFGGSSIWH